jgi:hypothetical protein
MGGSQLGKTTTSVWDYRLLYRAVCRSQIPAELVFSQALDSNRIRRTIENGSSDDAPDAGFPYGYSPVSFVVRFFPLNGIALREDTSLQFSCSYSSASLASQDLKIEINDLASYS